MTQAALEKKTFVYDDYLKTPDDKLYQLIGGELIMTPSPGARHQEIVRDLGFELNRFVKQKGAGKIFLTPFDVYFDNENVVQPDILFVSKDRLSIIGEKNVQGAPDLIIEIISESSAYRDMVQKKKLYAQFGVNEYWIVIPEQESLDAYVLKNGLYELRKSFTKNDVLDSVILSGLEVLLKEIF